MSRILILTRPHLFSSFLSEPFFHLPSFLPNIPFSFTHADMTDNLPSMTDADSCLSDSQLEVTRKETAANNALT